MFPFIRCLAEVVAPQLLLPWSQFASLPWLHMWAVTILKMSIKSIILHVIWVDCSFFRFDVWTRWDLSVPLGLGFALIYCIFVNNWAPQTCAGNELRQRAETRSSPPLPYLTRHLSRKQTSHLQRLLRWNWGQINNKEILGIQKPVDETIRCKLQVPAEPDSYFITKTTIAHPRTPALFPPLLSCQPPNPGRKLSFPPPFFCGVILKIAGMVSGEDSYSSGIIKNNKLGVEGQWGALK